MSTTTTWAHRWKEMTDHLHYVMEINNWNKKDKENISTETTQSSSATPSPGRKRKSDEMDTRLKEAKQREKAKDQQLKSLEEKYHTALAQLLTKEDEALRRERELYSTKKELEKERTLLREANKMMEEILAQKQRGDQNYDRLMDLAAKLAENPRRSPCPSRSSDSDGSEEGRSTGSSKKHNAEAKTELLHSLYRLLEREHQMRFSSPLLNFPPFPYQACPPRTQSQQTTQPIGDRSEASESKGSLTVLDRRIDLNKDFTQHQPLLEGHLQQFVTRRGGHASSPIRRGHLGELIPRDEQEHQLTPRPREPELPSFQTMFPDLVRYGSA